MSVDKSMKFIDNLDRMLFIDINIHIFLYFNVNCPFRY